MFMQHLVGGERRKIMQQMLWNYLGTEKIDIIVKLSMFKT